MASEGKHTAGPVAVEINGRGYEVRFLERWVPQQVWRFSPGKKPTLVWTIGMDLKGVAQRAVHNAMPSHAAIAKAEGRS